MSGWVQRSSGSNSPPQSQDASFDRKEIEKKPTASKENPESIWEGGGWIRKGKQYGLLVTIDWTITTKENKRKNRGKNCPDCSAGYHQSTGAF